MTFAGFGVWIPGVPRPQGSLKIVTSASTGQAFAKNSATLIDYRNFAVGEYAKAWGEQSPLDVPVSVRAVFHLPRPKAHFGTGKNAGKIKPSAPRWPTGAPDLDKMLRTHGDAMTIARIVTDDALIVEIAARKSWAGERGPGAQISVVPLESS